MLHSTPTNNRLESNNQSLARPRVDHLRWLRDQTPNQRVELAVITTGPEAYRTPDQIAVIPLALPGR